MPNCRRCVFAPDNIVHTRTAEQCNAEGARLGYGYGNCLAPFDHHPFEADTRELTAGDWATIRDALMYAADDYAERANYEEKHECDCGCDGESADFRQAANRYSAVLDKVSE